MKANRKEDIVKNAPGPCPSCPNYCDCVAACDKVTMWIEQDHVGRNSNLVLENGSASSTLGDGFLDLIQSSRGCQDNDRDSTGSQDAWETVKSLRLSEKVSRFIYSYYMLGRRIRDIACLENATSQAIDQRHFQAKKTISERLERRQAWAEARDSIEYSSIRQYDMFELFYGHNLSRKVISKIIRVNVSTVSKHISKQGDVTGG